MADETPKLIIDDDWKSQAQREKERLAAAEAAKKPGAGGPPGGGGSGAAAATGGGAGQRPAAPGQGQATAGAAGGGGHEMEPEGEGEMPPADFTTLVGTIVTNALLYLGGFPDPQTGRAVVSLEHARFNIDLLAVLQEKTKGNLTPEEDRDLSQTVNELRLRYVEIARAIAKMAAEGKLGGQGGMGGGGMGGMGGPSGMGGGPNIRLS